MHAFDSEKEAGNYSEHVVARKPAHDAGNQQDTHRAQQRDHEAPPERGNSKHVFTRGDDPLAHGRVYNEGTLICERFDSAPVVTGTQHEVFVTLNFFHLDAESQKSPAIHGVIRFVEHHSVRLAEVGEAHNPAEDGHRTGAHPGAPPAGGEGRHEMLLNPFGGLHLPECRCAVMMSP